jgi:hypothetical protein
MNALYTRTRSGEALMLTRATTAHVMANGKLVETVQQDLVGPATYGGQAVLQTARRFDNRRRAPRASAGMWARLA